jgi:hypothetical protein
MRHYDGWMIRIAGGMDAGVGRKSIVSPRKVFDKTYVTRWFNLCRYAISCEVRSENAIGGL